MRFREVEQLAHDHTASTCRRWGKKVRFDSEFITFLSLFPLHHAASFKFSLPHPVLSWAVHKNSALSHTHTHHPGVLLKGKFWPSRSGGRPGSLHFWSPRGGWCTCPTDHTLSSKRPGGQTESHGKPGDLSQQTSLLELHWCSQWLG